jgi:amino acid transporter
LVIDQESLGSEARFQVAAGPALAGVATPSPTESDGRLHRRLSSFGVLLLTLSCLSPVFSIFGVGADVLQHAGSGAAILFLLGIGAAVIWAVVYAELGSAYPYAGGDYVGVGSILGPWAGVLTLAIWAATSGPSVAFEAKIIAVYVAELAPNVPVPVITFGSLGAALVIALLAVRTGALVTGLFLAVEMAAVLALIVCGFWHPVRGLGSVVVHQVALNAGGTLAPVTIAVLAVAAISAVYGTVGGNQALYFGEELRDPHKRMGRVVIAAALIGAVATALPVIGLVLGVGNLAEILKSPAPFATFVSQAAGPWAGRALSLGVALAIFNAMIAQVMFNARLFFSLGRDGLFNGGLNRLLAGVHADSGAPRAATLIVGAFSVVCCFLSSHILLVFLTGLLVYGWSLVCLAVLVGRRKGLTGQQGYWRSPLYPVAPALGLVMAAVFTVADLADADAGRPSLIVLGLVAAASVLWSQFVLKRRPGGWTPTLATLEP